MKRLRSILNYKQKYTYILFIFVIVYSLFITNINYKSKYKITDTSFIGTVLSIKKTDIKTTLIIKSKEKLIVNYYDKITNINIGDTICIKGVLSIPKNNTVPNLFNYKRYLFNNKIYYILKADSITKVKNNTNIFNYYKYKLENYINSKKSSVYLNIFILSNKNYLEDEINNSYQVNGLSHLFSISGMHITLLLGTILKLLDKISYSRVYKYIVLIVILIIYMFFTSFTPSILRSGITFILLSINKLCNFNIKKINIIMLVLVFILIMNPFYLYNIGFQLSYLISFYLILFSYKINKHKSYFSKLLYISFLSFIVSFPLIINNNFQINILSIIINLLFVPIISYVVLPLTFITLILPIDDILLFIMNILESISLFCSNIRFGQIIFSKPSIYLIIIYYIYITLSIYKRKYIIYLIIIIIYHQIKVYFNNNMNIITLDVGQGDSILINYPNNKGNILIDTGGNYNYDTGQNIIVPYLKSIGIKKLDYLIITHGDYDHIMGSIYLVNNFSIDKVILNRDNYNDLELELIKVLNKRNIKYYKRIKEINIDVNKLYFLNNKTFDNENDNSNVLYFNYNNYKFLFMGDAGIKVEDEILKEYNLNNIDILKVGHHGSKTSTSKKFIDIINPKYSLISVGRNNIYGHPNREVIDKLNNSIIYRTDINGSIIFRISKDRFKIINYTP